MKLLKRIILSCFIFVLLYSTSAAAAPYDSYNYINGSNGVVDVEAPAAYVPVRIIDSSTLDVELSAPEDICIDADGNFYILDSETGVIHSYTPEFEKRYSIFGYVKSGETNPETLKRPQGICVQKDTLYVAETDSHQIMKFDINTRQMTGIISQPESELFEEGFEFRPKKIAVDDTGRIFVVAENVFQGLMELNQEGEFVGYVGGNSVVANPFEVIFRLFLTDAQIKGRVSFVPVEYTNISLDNSGFIYAVTAASDVNTPIRRLNPGGQDILVRNPVNGVETVSGDLLYNEYSSKTEVGPSSFVDITVNKQGIYYALDNKRGRIFAYDEDGNLLFEFGGDSAYKMGTFTQPCALEIVGNRVYVMDRERRNITVFEPTPYAESIIAATASYAEGDYETAKVQWESLLKSNSNFDLAYVKAGFCLYRMGEYQDAMDHFKSANSREYYNKALVKYRKEWMNENFGIIAAGAAAGVLLAASLAVVLMKLRKRRLAAGKDGTHYVFQPMVHPVDSFWEMKFQGKGNVFVAVLLVLAFFLVSILERQSRAFVFNSNYNTPLDIMYQLRMILIPVVLFCISNWAVTTLLDGKGKMKDIFIVTAHSLVPLTIFKIIGIAASHAFTLNEIVYLSAVDYLGIIWFAIVLVIGIMTIHQYSWKKTLATFILTAAAAAIVIFVVLLFFSMFSEIFGFIYSIYREMTLRI